MSDPNIENTESTVEENYVSTATTKEMTRGAFMKAEHEVQTGVSETLPDGRTVKEASDSLANLQAQQEKDLAERGKKWMDKAAAKTSMKTGDDFLNEKVQVTGFENGAVSARPIPEIVEDKAPEEPDNDLPGDFPGRKVFLFATPPITRLEDIAKLDRDALIGINGIGEKTADSVLAYGKS